MKNYLRILCLMFALALYSCSDNCDAVDCGPGVCEDGTCVCPDGLEGDNCEIISISSYYGDYQVVDPTCGTSSNTTNIGKMSIVAHSNGNLGEIELTAIGSTITGTLDGIIVNGNINAEGDFGSGTLKIVGVFSDSDNFEVTLTALGLICSGVRYAK